MKCQRIGVVIAWGGKKQPEWGEKERKREKRIKRGRGASGFYEIQHNQASILLIVSEWQVSIGSENSLSHMFPL